MTTANTLEFEGLDFGIGSLEERFAAVAVLGGLPLTDLTLPLGCTDVVLGVLRGTPLTRLDLGGVEGHGCRGRYTPEGLIVLAGLPLTDLSATAWDRVFASRGSAWASVDTVSSL